MAVFGYGVLSTGFQLLQAHGEISQSAQATIGSQYSSDPLAFHGLSRQELRKVRGTINFGGAVL